MSVGTNSSFQAEVRVCEASGTRPLTLFTVRAVGTEVSVLGGPGWSWGGLEEEEEEAEHRGLGLEP